MRIIYTVTQPIVDALGQQVELVIGARSSSPTERRHGTQVRVRDGGRYSELDRFEFRHSVSTTRIYDGAVSPEPGVVTLKQWRQFMRSTANMETFVWDQYGHELGVADDPIQVFTRSTSTTYRRIMRTRYFRSTFQVEEIE